MGNGTLRRSALLSLAGVCCAVALACNTTVELPFPDATTNPTSPTPSPSPTLPVDYGDGHDGSITVTAGNTLKTTPCVGVVTASNQSVTLASGFPSSLLPNDRILLLQHYDVFATSGVQTPFEPSRAGHWEVGRVQSAPTATVTVLQLPLSRKYESSPGPGSKTLGAQACLMRQYSTVTVDNSGVINTVAFDGTSGGIVAFYASDSLTVEGTIDGDGFGYRGGLAGIGAAAETASFDVPSGAGGHKGEGLDATSYKLSGRGNLANAGGGGNAVSAGGGGGGCGGKGGDGGRSSTATATTGGLGGAAIANSSRILAFGGGGGGGQGLVGQNPAPGGAGGGIVLLIARQMHGTSQITARGDAGAPGSNGGGSGGSGAGGTIMLVSSNGGFHGALNVTTYPAGGSGAGAGPGGGGAGGRIIASDAQLTTAAQLILAGQPSGAPGTGLPGTDGASGQAVHADVNPNAAN